MAATGATTGIVITVTPDAVNDTVYIERSTVSGSGFAVIGSVKNGEQDYTDPLPINGVTYYYRAYAARAGYANSANSAEVSGTPQDLTAL
jgi:hypothetical protein